MLKDFLAKLLACVIWDGMLVQVIVPRIRSASAYHCLIAAVDMAIIPCGQSTASKHWHACLIFMHIS